MITSIDLWFDFSCPYAYLASRRAPALGVEVRWQPMLLGGVFRGIDPTGGVAPRPIGAADRVPTPDRRATRVDAGDGPMATLSPAKAAHNLRDMHRWAERFGVPLRVPAGHPRRTVRALRVLLALPHSRWPAAIAALFAAYWVDEADVTADAVIAEALGGAGIAEAEVAEALRRADDPAIKDELRRRTDEALALGVFGAPAWIARRPGGAPILVWGQDRFPWLEAILAGWDPEAGEPPGGPRPVEAPAQVTARGLDVYFDVASPFAYFALTQLPALVANGPAPRLAPILLGALFRDIDQRDVPLFAYPAPKRSYVGLELLRWARWWGVPFVFPSKFPRRTIAAQRLALLAARESPTVGMRLAAALGRAMWAEQRDLEDAATLRAILAAEELPAAWLERTQEPEVKAALAANTAAARDAGVFGVPAFVVDAGAARHLVWGQDRLDFVAAMLAGWQPRHG